MKKKALIVSTLLLCAMSFSRTYAISEFDIKKKTLDELLDRQTYDLNFEEYLVSKNKDKRSYYSLVNMHSSVPKEVMAWYEIDSGLIFYEDLLFSHPKIKLIYNEISEVYPNNKEETNKKIIIKNLIASIDDIEKILKESINEHADLKNIFKNKSKREPNEKELQWLKDIKTLKYAAYSGKLNRELTQDDINKIDNKRGFELMSLDFELYDILNIVRQLEEYVQEDEILYYKTYIEFEIINLIIESAFEVDIFKEISETERLNIYIKSTDNMILNKLVLLTNTLEFLVEKGIISEDDFEIEDDIPSFPEYEEDKDNPYIDRIEELNKNKAWKNIQAMLSKKYSDIFNNLSFKISGGDSEICFKINNKLYNTNIFINNRSEIFKYQENILSKIAQLFKGKNVKSKEKTMLCLNNGITVYKNEVDGINYFDYLNKVFKKIGIEIFLKEK